MFGLQLCNQLANEALYLDFCLGKMCESQWLTQNPGKEFLCNLWGESVQNVFFFPGFSPKKKKIAGITLITSGYEVNGPENVSESIPWNPLFCCSPSSLTPHYEAPNTSTAFNRRSAVYELEGGEEKKCNNTWNDQSRRIVLRQAVVKFIDIVWHEEHKDGEKWWMIYFSE